MCNQLSLQRHSFDADTSVDAKADADTDINIDADASVDAGSDAYADADADAEEELCNQLALERHPFENPLLLPRPNYLHWLCTALQHCTATKHSVSQIALCYSDTRPNYLHWLCIALAEVYCSTALHCNKEQCITNFTLPYRDTK